MLLDPNDVDVDTDTQTVYSDLSDVSDVSMTSHTSEMSTNSDFNLSDTSDDIEVPPVASGLDTIDTMDISWSLPVLHNKCIYIDSSIANDCNGYNIQDFSQSLMYYLKYRSDRDPYQILIPSKMYYYPPSLDRSLNIGVFIEFLTTFINIANTKQQLVHPIRLKDFVFIDTRSETIGIHPDASITSTSETLTFVPIAILPKSGTLGHLNVLVIDNADKTFTYYEPYGYINPQIDPERLQYALQEIIQFVKKRYPNYIYIDAHINTLNKTIGVQYRSESFYHISEGYCVAWCLYICYIRLFNFHLLPQYSISNLLNKIFEHYTDGNLTTLIRVFISYVTSIVPNARPITDLNFLQSEPYNFLNY